MAEFAKLPGMRGLRGLRASVPAYQHQRGLCANVSACKRAESIPTANFYVSTCQ